jgi:hypothetical protein
VASARSRLLIALGGSAVLALAALVVVLAIGIRYVPGYPSVEERPEPLLTGRIAYIRWNDAGGACVHGRAASGGPDTVLWCAGGAGGYVDKAGTDVYPEWIDWDADGRLLVYGYGPNGLRRLTIEVTTGQIVTQDDLSTSVSRPDLTTRADGAVVGTTWHDDGTAEVMVRVPDGRTTTLFRDRGPDGYTIWNAQWSPHGDFVLAFDNERRVLVISATGEPRPRVLVRDADQVVWYQPA